MDSAPVEETTSPSVWGPVPAPVVSDGEGDPDANPWGSVAATEPSVTRGRSKNAGGKLSKSRSRGKGATAGTKGAPKSDPPPTPSGGFPLNPGPVADDAEVPPTPLPDADPPALPAIKPAAKKPGKKPGKSPKGRIPAPSTAQQRKIKKTLRRGLPKMLDRPLVLVLAGVVAAVLGLGTGWGMNLYRTGGSAPQADAASCAQTQMAWTQAANAQSAMVEDQPDTLRKGFVNARNALEGVTPPEAIAQDWAVAFTYYSTVANNIEKVNANDGPAVISAVGGAQQELDTEAMVEASETISLYVNSNCKQ